MKAKTEVTAAEMGLQRAQSVKMWHTIFYQIFYRWRLCMCGRQGRMRQRVRRVAHRIAAIGMVHWPSRIIIQVVAVRHIAWIRWACIDVLHHDCAIGRAVTLEEKLVEAERRGCTDALHAGSQAGIVQMRQHMGWL